MLRRFFENPPVLPLNLKFFLKSTRPSLPLKKGLSKTHQSSLNLKKSSKTHQSSLSLKFFLKSTRPSLPLKKAPPLSPSPFPLRVQGMYQPPYSVLKPLRYKVGGPSEVYASFLCGMGPQGENLLKNGCVGWDHRDKMDGALRNLLILSSYSP